MGEDEGYGFVWGVDWLAWSIFFEGEVEKCIIGFGAVVELSDV